MSIFGLPLISFKTGVVATSDMGDMEYLAIKRFLDKLRKPGETNPTCAEGFKSTTGDLAVVTAATGKDLYLAKAKIVYFNTNTTSASGPNKVELQINGVVVETASYANAVALGGGGGASLSREYKFESLSHSVKVAAQTIKLKVISISSNVNIEGFVECYDQDAGTSPQERPLNPA